MNRTPEWLPPSTASLRPAAPGKGIYLHRATDTGAVTLWDGAAWQDVSGDGGSAGIPGKPSDILTDAGSANTFVVLDDGGVGDAVDAEHLRNLAGAAASPTYGSTAGRPAASQWLAGQIYHDTDTGLRYACLTTGSGVWTWALLSNATALRGVSIDATAPTAKWQLLRYDPGTSSWKVSTYPPWSDAFRASTTTSSTSPGTCGAAIAMADNSALTVQITVRATKTDLSAAASWVITATYVKASGVVALQGSEDVQGPVGDALVGAVAMAADAVTLNITPGSSASIDWVADWKVYA